MDVCERTANHDPRGAEWRDRFFVDCSAALMDPRNAVAVGQQPWLPALLRCAVVRLNMDEPPLLPAREAIAALQLLASIARCAEARPAVKQAVLSLGGRAEELFHDRLQGIRSFAAAVGDDEGGKSSAGNNRSVVHNTLVVTLMRVEGYQLGADALLELVDHDVGALVSILLAVAKVASYEMGVTANCLTVLDALTHPTTYFTTGSTQATSPSHETRFSEFTAKIRVLIQQWSATHAYDNILSAVHRRAARFASFIPATASGALAVATPTERSPVSPAPPASIQESNDEASWFAAGMRSLCRAVANMVLFSPDTAQTTGLRQHVLVVQEACATFSALLTALAGAAAGAEAASKRREAQHIHEALAAVLELFCLASRDVPRVVAPLRVAILISLNTVVSGTRGRLAPRLLTAAAVAMVNAGAPSMATEPEMVDVHASVVQELTRAMLRASTPSSAALEPWLDAVSAHPNLNHQRAAAGLAQLRASAAADLDDQVAMLDDESAKLEADLRELQNDCEEDQIARLDDETAKLEADLREMQKDHAEGAAQRGQTQPQAVKVTATSLPNAGSTDPVETAPTAHGNPGAYAGKVPHPTIIYGSLLGTLPSLPGGGGSAGRGPSTAPRDEAPVAGASAANAPKRPQQRRSDAPPEFLCALRGTVMFEPVRLPCGRHVDKNTLDDVIREIGHVDPVTAKPLPIDFDPKAIDADLKRRITVFQFNAALASGASAI
jgi:uncharacterized small protein (DUF1192 family)